jgi:hypothetical protein
MELSNEKLLKQVNINKNDLNGIKIIAIQAYGKPTKNSGEFDVEFYYLTDYKGYKNHQKIYGYERFLTRKEIISEINKIRNEEYIISEQGQNFVKEHHQRMTGSD